MANEAPKFIPFLSRKKNPSSIGQNGTPPLLSHQQQQQSPEITTITNNNNTNDNDINNVTPQTANTSETPIIKSNTSKSTANPSSSSSSTPEQTTPVINNIPLDSSIRSDSKITNNNIESHQKINKNNNNSNSVEDSKFIKVENNKVNDEDDDILKKIDSTEIDTIDSAYEDNISTTINEKQYNNHEEKEEEAQDNEGEYSEEEGIESMIKVEPTTPTKTNKLLKLVNKKSLASTNTAFFNKELFKAKLVVFNPEYYSEDEISDINSNSIVSEVYKEGDSEGIDEQEKERFHEYDVEEEDKQKQIKREYINKKNQNNRNKNNKQNIRNNKNSISGHHNMDLINSLEDEKNYTKRYRYLKKNEEELNKPIYKEVEDDHPTAPYNKPSGYIIYQEKSNEQLNDEIEYDMDSEDEKWLIEFNNSSNTNYGDDDLEFVIDRLEKETFSYKQESGGDMFPHFSSVEADDVCAVCFDGQSDDTNQIVYCDGCDIAVHQDCYGILLIPEGHWFCQRCESPDKDQITCVICGKKNNGGFKQTIDGEWVHLVCVYNINELAPIIKKGSCRDKLGPVGLLGNILKQRYKLKCSICKKKVGACIQCMERNCSIAFHPWCIKNKQKAIILNEECVTHPNIIFCNKHFQKKILNGQDINEKNGSDQQLFNLDSISDDENDSSDSDDDSSDSDDGYNSDYYDDEDDEVNVNKRKKKKTPSKSNSKITTPKKTPSKSNSRKKDSSVSKSTPIKKSNNRSTNTTTTTTGITAKKAGLISISKATKKIRSYPSQFVHGVYNYWVKKRISRSGLALIKRLQPSIIFSARSSRLEPGINTVQHYNKLLAIRKDLERCRTILELIRKRERQKRELILTTRDTIEYLVFNEYFFLRSILKTLESIELLRPFYMPVSEEEAPTYFTVIKQPMSFHQMKHQLNNYEYQNSDEFFKDLTLIYTNAQLFNSSKTSIFKASKVLQEITHKLEFNLPDKITPIELDSFIKLIVKPTYTPNKLNLTTQSLTTTNTPTKISTTTTKPNETPTKSKNIQSTQEEIIPTTKTGSIQKPSPSTPTIKTRAATTSPSISSTSINNVNNSITTTTTTTTTSHTTKTTSKKNENQLSSSASLLHIPKSQQNKLTSTLNCNTFTGLPSPPKRIRQKQKDKHQKTRTIDETEESSYGGIIEENIVDESSENNNNFDNNNNNISNNNQAKHTKKKQKTEVSYDTTPIKVRQRNGNFNEKLVHALYQTPIKKSENPSPSSTPPPSKNKRSNKEELEQEDNEGSEYSGEEFEKMIDGQEKIIEQEDVEMCDIPEEEEEEEPDERLMLSSKGRARKFLTPGLLIPSNSNNTNKKQQQLKNHSKLEQYKDTIEELAEEKEDGDHKEKEDDKDNDEELQPVLKKGSRTNEPIKKKIMGKSLKNLKASIPRDKLDDQQQKMLDITDKISDFSKGEFLEKKDRQCTGKESISFLEHIDFRIYRGSYSNFKGFWDDINKIINKIPDPIFKNKIINLTNKIKLLKSKQQKQ